MEKKGSKNMTIELHIKLVSLKVTEQTQIVVYWSRGTNHPFIFTSSLFLNLTFPGEKKAKTKPRLLNESVTQAIMDEKF